MRNDADSITTDWFSDSLKVLHLKLKRKLKKKKEKKKENGIICYLSMYNLVKLSKAYTYKTDLM